MAAVFHIPLDWGFSLLFSANRGTTRNPLSRRDTRFYLGNAIEQGQAIETLTAQLAKRQAEEEEIKASIAKEKLQDGFSATVESVISYLSHIRDGSENDIFYRQSLVNIYVDSVYLYDTSDGKNKKISVHLNTRNGVKEIPILNK